ncbi:MAG: RNA polymerase sigma factor [Pseudomonadota bacterium]
MAKTGETEVREGLEALVPRLWRYALVLTGGHRADADDLTQAAVLRALERAGQFQPGTRLDRWCFTVLASIWKNELRSRAVRRGEGQVPVEEAGLATPDHAHVNILAGEVLTCMTTLPEAMRETMFLVYVEGYSYAEAAERLEIPIGTVMSRLANGRRKLNAAMVER